jgi:DNA-binding NarL/FixJ family response regulator
MRVVIAEDSVVLRDGLVRLLTAKGHEIVGEADDPAGLLAAVNREIPDVTVVDVRMPPTHTDDGLRAAIDIRRQHPSVAILVFSQYIEVPHARRLLATGAEGIGYLLKDRVGQVGEFVEALERVAAGGTVLDPTVVSRLMLSRRDSQRASDGGLGALSPRELEVLGLMAEGRSNAAIASALVVSAGAVEKYVGSIFTKLGLPTTGVTNRRVLAVLRYLQQGRAEG